MIVPYFRRLHRSFKLGIHEMPILYLGLGYFLAGIALFVYFDYKKRKYNLYIPRHKYVYTIMRPDDDRLELIPRTHVTEKHLLPADHPETLLDVKRTLLPPVKESKYWSQFMQDHNKPENNSK